jgi:hypothetical protein
VAAGGGWGGVRRGWGWGGGGGESWANLGRGAVMHTDSDQLDSLNSDMTLDASVLLNSHISDDENISQFFQTHIQSSYVDLNSFISAYRHSSQPLMLSLNIQSLSSKYEHLKILIQNLTASHVPIDVILLQETWEIKYPLLFNIPGFQNITYI